MLDSIFLYPLEGSFDVAAVDAHLAQQPDVLLDPLGRGIYMVCGSPELVDYLRDKRCEKPSEFPYAVLVTVKPDHINVFQQYGNEAKLRSARDLVGWLIAQIRCRIEDEYRNDWTERVAREGVRVLYPERLA